MERELTQVYMMGKEFDRIKVTQGKLTSVNFRCRASSVMSITSGL